jgi:Tol biopolymer transport system component
VDCDTNNVTDIFVKDLVTGSTERVSVTSSGAQLAHESSAPSISADGRYVLFETAAPNVVPNDVNGWLDVFIHDRQTKTTQKVFNVTGHHHGTQMGSISADNRYVAFASGEPMDGDFDPCGGPETDPDEFGICDYLDTYVVDRVTGQIQHMSHAMNDKIASGAFPAISADGNSVAYVGDDHIWVADRVTGITEQADVNAAGDSGDARTYPFTLTLSGDGSKVGFVSEACNLGTPCTTDGRWHPYVRDRTAGTTTMVGTDRTGTPLRRFAFSARISISRDGRYFAYDHDEDAATVVTSCSFPTSGPQAGENKTFQRDLVTGVTTIVGIAPSGACANGGTEILTQWQSTTAMSSDGAFVSFTTPASNLVPGDTNGVYEVYVKRLR